MVGDSVTKNADTMLAEAMQHLADGNYRHTIEQCTSAINAGYRLEAVYFLRAKAYFATGDIEAALRDLYEAIAINPNNDDLHLVAAKIYQNANKFLKAIDHSKQALQINRKNQQARQIYVSACIQLGDLYNQHNKLIYAEPYYDMAVQYKSKDAAYLYRVAIIKRRLGKNKEAEALANKVVRLNRNHIDAKALLVAIYEQYGELKKSENLICNLVRHHADNSLVCIHYASYALRTGKQQEAITRLLKFVEDGLHGQHDMPSIYTMLGKLYDSLREYDKAFQAFRQANQLQDVNYDPQSYVEYISGLIEFYSSDNYRRLPVSDNSSDELIYIVGMPRSGSTLVEQILSSHSRIYGAGELNCVNDVIESSERIFSFVKPYPVWLQECDTEQMRDMSVRLIEQTRQYDQTHAMITDKLPYNFHNIGFIHKLLPNVKIIDCVRDARDTSLSCYFQQFGGYHPQANSLSALGIHYKQYRRLMAHWIDVLNIPVHTIVYEDLIADTRGEVERLLKYIGVEWEEDCLNFNKNKRVVNTTSFNQVSKAIYTDSLKRWENYKDYLGELFDALEE